jgi:hypothetical protein
VKIYIDESGDLGFGPRMTKYFVIAGLIVRDDQPIRRCFAKIRNNTVKKSIKQLPEFKYHNSDDVTVRRVVQCVTTTDLDIAYALLRKDEVYDRLRSHHQTVYNYLCGSLVSAIVTRYQPSEPLDIIVDKSLNCVGQDMFNDYIVFKAMDQNRNGIAGLDSIRIAHKDSRQEACIQAADFIAGVVHRHYRDGNEANFDAVWGKTTIAFDYFRGRQK